MKKTSLIAALLLLALPAFLAAASTEALGPREPVTLELRNADLKDVITTLGAMANLAVVIDPGIEGKVSIRMEKVPFERILALLAKDNGISIRIEDGKPIASKVQGAAVVAPAMPDSLHDTPRFLVADYAGAAAAAPAVVIKTTGSGEGRCWIAEVPKDGGSSLEIPLRGSVLVVADLGYDPVWKTRALAVEAVGGALQKSFSLGPDGKAIFADVAGREDASRVVFYQLSADPSRGEGACSTVFFQTAEGKIPVTLSMKGIAGGPESNSYQVFSPRIQTRAGTVFKALGSEANSSEGTLREYAASGYISRDGKSVALAFKARAAWTDSGDGKQYYFTQAGESSGFVPLTRAGVLASTIPSGAATPRPVELRVFGEE